MAITPPGVHCYCLPGRWRGVTQGFGPESRKSLHSYNVGRRLTVRCLLFRGLESGKYRGTVPTAVEMQSDHGADRFPDVPRNPL